MPKYNTFEMDLGFFIPLFSNMGTVFQLGHANQGPWAAEGKGAPVIS